jgi:hypothetical protein
MADRLISCDDHMDRSQLHADLWTARLPASLLDRAPHVEERDGSLVNISPHPRRSPRPWGLGEPDVIAHYQTRAPAGAAGTARHATRHGRARANVRSRAVRPRSN